VYNERRRPQQERAALQAGLDRLRADVAKEDERMRGFKALMAEHLGITDIDMQDQSQEGSKVIGHRPWLGRHPTLHVNPA